MRVDDVKLGYLVVKCLVISENHHLHVYGNKQHERQSKASYT